MGGAVVSYAGIALGTFVAALVRGLYKRFTGKEPFPANPKGPLYKWFGGANHGSSREMLVRRLRDQEAVQLSAQLDRRPAPRFLVSKRKL